MLTLDSLNLDRVDLLKIDVEGFEKEVLLGAENTLSKTNRVIIEVKKQNKEFIENLMRKYALTKVKKEETYKDVYYQMYIRTGF